LKHLIKPFGQSNTQLNR